MSAAYIQYSLSLFDVRKRQAIIDSTGKFQVLTAGTSTVATCYSSPNGGTAMTLPGTLLNGKALFHVASSVTSVDMIVVTAAGHSVYLRGVTPSQGRIDIDPERITYKLHVPFTTSLSGVIYSSGLSLSQSMRVKDAYVRVNVADATALVDFGTSTAGVAAFVLGAITTVTGYRLVNEFTSGAEVLGSALAQTATNGNARLYHRPANATTALPIIFQNSTASGGTAAPAQGFLILEYDRLVCP